MNTETTLIGESVTIERLTHQRWRGYALHWRKPDGQGGVICRFTLRGVMRRLAWWMEP